MYTTSRLHIPEQYLAHPRSEPRPRRARTDWRRDWSVVVLVLGLSLVPLSIGLGELPVLPLVLALMGFVGRTRPRRGPGAVIDQRSTHSPRFAHEAAVDKRCGHEHDTEN